MAKPVSISGSGTMTFTSDNTYGTTTLLNGATLNLGTFGGSDAHGSLGLGDVTMSGGSTLNINRSGVLIFGGNVTGSGDSAGSVNQLGTSNTNIAGAITNVSTVNVSAGSLAVGGVINQRSGVVVTGGNLNAFGITGSGGLIVSGGGAGLAGTNSYSGGTMISGGTIILAGTGTSLPANSVLAVNGGTLDLRGNNVSLERSDRFADKHRCHHQQWRRHQHHYVRRLPSECRHLRGLERWSRRRKSRAEHRHRQHRGRKRLDAPFAQPRNLQRRHHGLKAKHRSRCQQCIRHRPDHRGAE